MAMALRAWSCAVMSASAPAIDAFVAVGASAIDPIPRLRQADITIIPNAVDFARLVPTIDRDTQREQWHVPPARRVVGMLGRLSPEKYPRALASTVACLPKNWVGVHIGDGPDFADAYTHGFAAAGTRIYWPGATEDPGSALGALDVLLHASDSEGFGLALGEGWLAGVSVVSTAVGVALDYPDLVESIPFRATGQVMAAAVLRAVESSRRFLAQSVARMVFSPNLFAGRWSDYLVEVAHADPRS